MRNSGKRPASEGGASLRRSDSGKKRVVKAEIIEAGELSGRSNSRRSNKAADSSGSSRSRALKWIKKLEEEELEEAEDPSGRSNFGRRQGGGGGGGSKSTRSRVSKIKNIKLVVKKEEVEEVEEEEEEDDDSVQFDGPPVVLAEARKKWPHRYPKVKKEGGNKGNDKSKNAEPPKLALRHYMKAVVDGETYELYDDVEVQGEDEKPNYIAKIVELFEGSNKRKYFTAQWYYRHVDTVIEERVHQELKELLDDKRVFYSDIKDENSLGCLVKKLKIVQVSPLVNSSEVPDCDYYCDMGHSLSYSTISKLPNGFLSRSRMLNESSLSRDSSSTISSEGSCCSEIAIESDMKSRSKLKEKKSLKLLDLYAGCGGMSTGLCLGAAVADVNLVARWAVDMNPFACESLRFNHPETMVRNESAEDFLVLLKEWKKLCMKYCSVNETADVEKNDEGSLESDSVELDPVENMDGESEELSDEEFEVEKFIDICFGDPQSNGEKGLYLKVQWKGYDTSYDSWEPIDNFSNCEERMKEFVVEGCKTSMLPLPGEADVVCGGPPCQGVSGFNRFRNTANPLKDEKNRQLIVFMDIVEYLKPKYVLMENVTDILKFVNGYLGRYAIGRLIAMKYQTRLGIMAAGSFGLPQRRMRAFFWGASPTQVLPQFPLPTHTVGNLSCPSNYPDILVTDENREIKPALVLEDILSDLPSITNDEDRDEMSYEKPPRTEFQKQIRLLKNEGSHEAVLYDHRPLKLNKDDFARVCRVPKKKGANFRNFPGVLVGNDNVVYFDPTMKRELLPSGNPLVPDYAMSFVKGKSSKPFGRLWHDEIVPTVVTRAEPHNQRILHPAQDRVLSIRENARIQGFPDYYKLFGPVKERYIQVGNAVAVPVGRALGYSLAQAVKGESTDKPLLALPLEFPN